MERISVLLADDHPVVRQGLRTLLELQDDIELVGEAADGAEAVARAEELLPDVVLIDLVMPELDGVEALRCIRAASPATRVIVLTSFGAAWAQGPKIVFTRGRGIYVINADGSGVRRIARLGPYDNPVTVGGWSRDGAVVFAAGHGPDHSENAMSRAPIARSKQNGTRSERRVADVRQ
jgi:hypothetical protein